jgi:uncharacterized protein involved in outer membrane biogenesis
VIFSCFLKFRGKLGKITLRAERARVTSKKTEIMALLRKALLSVVILLFVFFISLVVFIRFQGKNFIERQAGAILQRLVTIDQADFIFPMGVHLTDLSIEGLLFAPEAQVRCDLFALLGGRIRLAEVKLEAPVLTLHRTGGHQILWSGHDEPNVPTGSQTNVKPAASTHGIQAAIDKLTVTDGKIDFPSHEDEDSFNVSLQKIVLIASNVPLSGQSMDVGFMVQGTILDGRDVLSGSPFNGNGTLNWPKRNMDADLTVVNLQGNMDVKAHLSSQNNDMIVQGHLKTAQAAPDNAAQKTGLNDNLLTAAVQKAGMTIEMNFSFPMKMDRWELRNIDFSGNLIASKDRKEPADSPQAVTK